MFVVGLVRLECKTKEHEKDPADVSQLALSRPVHSELVKVKSLSPRIRNKTTAVLC